MHVYTWKETDDRPNFISIDIYTCKEFDLEKVFNGVSTHHFWHCDNQLFDVEFYYKRDIIAMISYSKNVKGHWWEQQSDFNKKWDPYNYLDNNSNIVSNKGSKLENIMIYLDKKRNTSKIRKIKAIM